jgi:hypothetical protein
MVMSEDALESLKIKSESGFNPLFFYEKAENLEYELLCIADTRKLGPMVNDVLAARAKQKLITAFFHTAPYIPADGHSQKQRTFFILEMWFKKG